jgi:hypothetical protein
MKTGSAGRKTGLMTIHQVGSMGNVQGGRLEQPGQRFRASSNGLDTLRYRLKAAC